MSELLSPSQAEALAYVAEKVSAAEHDVQLHDVVGFSRRQSPG